MALGKKIKYSFINILTGSDLSIRRLALMEYKSEKAGPVVWLTGCVHGDEVGGIFIIQEIFKRLVKGGLLKGSIYAFPLMNPIGFETISRGITLSAEDLNRAFPGDKNGTLAERIAEKIFTSISKTNPDLVLDIHNDWLSSIPYTLIDPYPGLKHRGAYEKSKILAMHTGFAVINEKEVDEDVEDLLHTLSGSLLQHDIPALTLEVGGASMVTTDAQRKDVEDGINSIWSVLSYLGMVRPMAEPFNYQLPTIFKNKILKYSHQPVCSSSGIIRYLVKPGSVIKADQPVARIYNVFGKLQETLYTVDDGLLLGHSDFSIAYPGAEIVAFGLV